VNQPASENALAPKQTRSAKKLQFSLQTIMLFTAVVAVFVAYFRTRDETAQLRRQLPGLREAARELIVHDPEQYAVVQHQPRWYDEFRWRIYLPEGRRYELFLATEKIENSNKGLPPATGKFELTPGEHELEIQQIREADDSWQVRILVDGETALTQKHPESWHPGVGSSGGSEFSSSQQQAVEQPLILFQRRFHEPTKGGGSQTPQVPSNGVMLWIEPIKGSGLFFSLPRATSRTDR
jgi:hypothetical protein